MESLLKANGKITYDQLGAKVASLQQHLLPLGVKRGDKVAQMLKNGTGWVVCEQTCLD